MCIVIACVLANRLYFSGSICKSQKRLDGKTVIITGCNTGIGFETALDLARRGAHVIMACRDSKKAEQAAKNIVKLTYNQNVDVEYLDLADLDTVRSFAKKMNEQLNKLDILVNNAGVMQCPHWKSAQGQTKLSSVFLDYVFISNFVYFLKVLSFSLL